MSLKTCSATIQGGLHSSFYKWGDLVGRRPCTVIWTSVIVVMLLSIRVFMVFGGTNLPQETEQGRLWVPQDADAIDDQNRYRSAFQRSYRVNTVIFTAIPEGGNMLTSAILQEVHRFDTMVQNQLNAYWEEDAGNLPMGAVHFADLCGRSAANIGDNRTETCAGAVSGHGLELWYRSDGTYDFGFTDAELAATVDSGRGIDPSIFPPGGRTVNIEGIFGGITRDASGRVTGARSIRLTYWLQGQQRDSDLGAAARAWEDQLNLLVGSRWTYSGLSRGSADPGPLEWSSSLVTLYPNTADADSRELGRAITADISAINMAYMIIFVYATIIFSRNHPTASRALLAASGIVSVGLAVMVAYGFSTLFVPLNPVVNVLPFILIGIGVDDMFILLFALEAQPVEMPVETRLGRAMASAGVSITITSLTDMIAFLLGMTSRLPALADFCTFAAIGIFADYCLQISFFAGWMALDVMRERKNRVDCCPCVLKPTDAESSCAPCCCCPCTYGTCKSSGSFGLRSFITQYYVPCLRNPVIKAVVLVGFAAFTGFSIYAATNLEQDFQRSWFVPADAALQDAYAMEDRYYGELGPTVWVVTPPTTEIDYSSVSGQQGLLRLGTNVQASEWVEAGSLSFWFLAFRSYVHSCDTTVYNATGTSAPCVRRACVDSTTGSPVYPYCSLAKVVRDADNQALATPPATDAKFMVDASGNAVAPGTALSESYVPPSRFWDYLDQWLEDEAQGQAFASEVVWVSTTRPRTSAQNSLGVTAARMRAQYRYARSAADRVATMDTMRDSVDAADFGSSYPFAFIYLFYEQFRIIRQEAFTNLGLALLACVAITLALVADVFATVLVAICVILTDVDILGMMWYWGLYIDSVSVINLVLAIGLALDYSVHIAHAFVQKPGASRQERIDAALEEMGTPVIHGCISTFLAVVVLSVSQSYVFVIFFRMFFGIVVFGGAHGLVLLPVVLSLIGPAHAGLESSPDDLAKGTAPKVMTMSTELPSISPTPAAPGPSPGGASAPPSPPASEAGGSLQDTPSPAARGKQARVAPAAMPQQQGTSLFAA